MHEIDLPKKKKKKKKNTKYVYTTKILTVWTTQFS